MAGDECRSTRSLTYQWSCASAQPCRNTHLSRGMPSVARDGHAGHHHGGRLVDVGMGVHQLRVRVADPAVGLAHRHQLLGAVALAPCGQRVGRGHRGKASHQRADGLLVVIDRTAACTTDGVLEQRVHDDGRAHAMQLFMLVPSAAGVANQLGRAARVFVPDAGCAAALQPLLGAQRLAAAQQHGVASRRERCFPQTGSAGTAACCRRCSCRCGVPLSAPTAAPRCAAGWPRYRASSRSGVMCRQSCGSSPQCRWPRPCLRHRCPVAPGAPPARSGRKANGRLRPACEGR